MRYFFDYFYFHNQVLPLVVKRGEDRYIQMAGKAYPFSHALIHTTDKVGVSIVCPELPHPFSEHAEPMP